MKIRRLGAELFHADGESDRYTVSFAEGGSIFVVSSADSDSRQCLFVRGCWTVDVTTRPHGGPLRLSFGTAAETTQIFVHFPTFWNLTLRNKFRLLFKLTEMQRFNGSGVLWHRSVWQIVVNVVNLNIVSIFRVEWRMAAADFAVPECSAQQYTAVRHTIL